jgi:hypothetical protein
MIYACDRLDYSVRAAAQSPELTCLFPKSSTDSRSWALAASFIRNQNCRLQNEWLWPIDRHALYLVPFRQQPPRSVEFGADPFGVPTIHPLCVSPPRGRPQ